ncbi:YggS family pyridoxal phosphate-dependent enzyme [Shewanella sp.]|uniref:YggS family pyridoxal phosphate-dependent enzyme n=1 Tax=Shewanella sp. TaxID=50422 RepID=UPI004053C239
MTTIADRLKLAQFRIAQAEQENHRPHQSVNLLAVSKTKPVSDIIEAYQAGQRSFGENYVQEGQQKIIELTPNYPDIEWHFIGPLQSNKTRIIAEHFDWLHTVSREKIAQRLQEQRPADKPPLNVCIQVNISGEDSKAGVGLIEVAQLASAIAAMPNLKLRGIMAIPSQQANFDNITQAQAELSKEFSQLKACFDTLKQTYPQLDTLSMGMSDDLGLAIAHGSTMVRIGSAIFGAR